MVRTVSETTPTPDSTTPAPAHTPAALPDSVSPDYSHDEPMPNWVRWAIISLSVVAAGAGWMAWNTDKRLRTLEQELVRRQQASQSDVAEARLLARQADELARQSAARTALLDTRLSEVALQRNQVEDLIKNLNVSRDENLVADLETSLRVAMQQSALTGSAEPLLIAMQSADERLGRAKQPRLDNVRRALARDLDRLKATRVADVNNLSIRLDEAVRLVDDVPLINQPEATVGASNAPTPAAPKPATKPVPTKPGRAQAATAASAPASATEGWSDRLLGWSQSAASTVWHEAQSLVRINKVRQPEGMLLAPEQSFFLRENIKLRLLNARLSLMSRQTGMAQAELKAVQDALPRYFDASSRKTQLLASMIDDVSAQTRLTTLPRPDDTLAALVTVSGGR